MSGLFNPENAFWKFMGKLWDALWLSILWTVCSIPIVTIGASTTALYYVTMKLVKDEETYVTKQFFKAFKQNFKQSTIVWILMLLCLIGIISSFFYFLYQDSKFATFVMGLAFVMFIIWIFISIYIYAGIARFTNSIKNLFVIAATFASKHIGWTLLNILIEVLIVAVAYVFPPMFIPGMGWIAFFQSFSIRKIFDKYIIMYLHIDPRTGEALEQDAEGNYVLPREKDILTEDVDMSVFEVRENKQE